MADNTTLAESAQALFCAFADYAVSNRVKLDDVLDAKEFPTYKIFRLAWNGKFKTNGVDSIFKKHIETPSVTLAMMEDFLNENPDWYVSSVLIAKKLIEDIDSIVRNFNGIKRPKSSEVWFVRGDKPIMKNIEELFKAANDTSKKMNTVEGAKKSVIFGDINKWSPADIYFASDKARKIIQECVTDNKGSTNKGFSFLDLNVIVSDLIETGQLLPLSLKKQTRSVILQKVNFNRTDELKTIKKYHYGGHSDWKVYKETAPQTRDLKVYFTDNKADHIKIRHDASSAAFKAEYQGANAEARGGSIGSAGIFGDLIELVDAGYAKKFKAAYEKANKEYREKVKSLGTKPTNPKDKKAYDEVRGQYSAMLVTNVVFPPLIKWLDADKERSDKFIRLIYQYITSRTEESSKFVIAK
jgi:hypothetical protein